MKVSKIWLLSLDRFRGKVICIKGNDSAVIELIKGYLCFLLQECEVQLLPRDDILKNGYALYSDNINVLQTSNKNRYMVLLCVDKRQKVNFSEVDVFLSVWKQYPHSYRETLTRLGLNDNFELTTKKLNIQEQILTYLLGTNLFRRDSHDDSTRSRLRMRYTDMIMGGKIFNDTIMTIVNYYV